MRGSIRITRFAASVVSRYPSSSPIVRSAHRRRTTCGISSPISAASCHAIWLCRFSRASTHSTSACPTRRKKEPDLILGGWANPHAAAAQQVDFLLDERFCAEFYLTQVVSHVDLGPVKRFLAEIDRRPVPIPGMFCVFYYRSANPKTLKILSTFMPVPIQGLIDEFATGATAAKAAHSANRASLLVAAVGMPNSKSDAAS